MAIAAFALLAALGTEARADKADAGGPYVVVAEESVTVDAAGSDLSDCKSWFVAWDWDGDGAEDTTWVASTTSEFFASGIDGPAARTITVFVLCSEDSGGGTEESTDDALVQVKNAPPVVTSLDVPASLAEGEVAVLTASWDDPEPADTQSVVWSFDDGEFPGVSRVERSFADDGSATVTFTVTDDDGDTDSESAVITVENVAPVIEADPATEIAPGDQYRLSPTATDPGVLDEHTWALDPVPDGSDFDPTTGAFIWTPTEPGTTAFTLAVDDGDGGSDEISWAVEVREGSGDDTGPSGARDTAHPQSLDTAAPDRKGDPGCTCAASSSRGNPGGLLLLGLASLRRRR